MVFLNTARSLFLWHKLAHFGILYLCLLNPCKSSHQNLQMGTIKQSRTQLKKLLIPVANTSTDDMYVTTSCCLAMWLPNLIAQMAQSIALNCTYSGTKLLNSYWAMLSIPWVYRDTQAALWHQYILFQVSKVGSKCCVLHLMHEKVFSQLRVAKVLMFLLLIMFVISVVLYCWTLRCSYWFHVADMWEDLIKGLTLHKTLNLPVFNLGFSLGL